MVLTPITLVLLLLGPVIALGSFRRPELLQAGALWMLVVLALAAADALVGRLTSHIEARRSFAEPLSLNAPNPVDLSLRNRSRLPQDWIVLDDVPEDLRPRGNLQRLRAAPYATVSMRYWVNPARRGDFVLRDVWVRGLGLLGLARWQRRLPARQA
ncbi:MAG: hypothetical protein H5T86_07695, partial [Armatimonadetes bacterium]|nr:hypothetical protein [Armatimonadota bacterium]